MSLATSGLFSSLLVSVCSKVTKLNLDTNLTKTLDVQHEPIQGENH
jgi:hypothetical protein